MVRIFGLRYSVGFLVVLRALLQVNSTDRIIRPECRQHDVLGYVRCCIAWLSSSTMLSFHYVPCGRRRGVGGGLAIWVRATNEAAWVTTPPSDRASA